MTPPSDDKCVVTTKEISASYDKHRNYYSDDKEPNVLWITLREHKLRLREQQERFDKLLMSVMRFQSWVVLHTDEGLVDADISVKKLDRIIEKARERERT